MNKKLICFNLFFFFFIVIVSLFSCKNSPVIEPINPQHTVNFYVWNNNQNKYIESTQTVEEGTLFSSISKPSTPTFEKDGNRYIFEDWVEKYTPSDVENSIIVRGVNINENIEIKAPKTFYAKYNSKAIIRHTVLFNIWDKSQNKYIEKSQSIEEGTLFGSITKPEPPIFDRNSSTYTFLGWVEKADFINDFNILTEGEIVNNNIQISANKSYYAKYTSSPCFNVTLRIYDKDLSKYVNFDFFYVEQGTTFGSITKNNVPSFDKDDKTYIFEGWVERTSSPSDILTEEDIIEDTKTITTDKTYYAKYSIKGFQYTVKFYIWDNNNNKYVATSKNVRHGDLFGSIQKPPTPSFVKDGISYSYKHWSTDVPNDNKLITIGTKFDESTQITSNITLYSVYKIIYTVTFKEFDPLVLGYNTIASKEVEHNSYFKDIQWNVLFTNRIENHKGYDYTFKHWTAEKIDENIINTTRAKFDENMQITSNITFYVVYEKGVLNSYTVTFKSFNKSCHEYSKIKEVEEVSYGTYFKIIEKPKKPDDIIIGGTKYSFYGWADISSSDEIIEEFQQEKVDENKLITENKVYCAIYNGDYLTFTAVEFTTVSFDIYSSLDNPISLQYRTGTDTKFVDYTWGNNQTEAKSGNGLKIVLNKGEKVYFKGNNSNISSYGVGIRFLSGDAIRYLNFKSTGKVKASGCVMSLLNRRDIVPNYCFKNLFYKCPLLTAPSLPATTIGVSCYDGMFMNCRSLTEAPELPATTLAKNCYTYMFYYCTSLTKAPELPATTLAESCYRSMFYECTSIKEAPELPATTLDESCYSAMFFHCRSLKKAPKLPATTLAQNCYNNMFLGCTSLTEAPELSATTLAESCYSGMFEGCTSLKEAPELPATELADSCYYFMFKDCISLTEAPELSATTLAESCYGWMFYYCKSLTEAPELPATTLAQGCYGNMFNECLSLTEAPKLPATTLADYCYYNMFSGCTSLTKAPELPATTLAESCYSGMFYGCTSLTEAPSLPATTLADYCYWCMFKECTSLTSITCLATDISADNCLYYWVSGVATRGTFKCKAGVDWTKGDSGIPIGWRVEYV